MREWLMAIKLLADKVNHHLEKRQQQQAGGGGGGGGGGQTSRSVSGSNCSTSAGTIGRAPPSINDLAIPPTANARPPAMGSQAPPLRRISNDSDGGPQKTPSFGHSVSIDTLGVTIPRGSTPGRQNGGGGGSSSPRRAVGQSSPGQSTAAGRGMETQRLSPAAELPVGETETLAPNSPSGENVSNYITKKLN